MSDLKLEASCCCGGTVKMTGYYNYVIARHDAFLKAHADCSPTSSDTEDDTAPALISHGGASTSSAQEQTPDLIGSGLWRDPDENGEDARRRIGFRA